MTFARGVPGGSLFGCLGKNLRQTQVVQKSYVNAIGELVGFLLHELVILVVGDVGKLYQGMRVLRST